MIIVASNVSSHCGILIVFDVKDMTLESVYDCVLSLSYILCVVPDTFYTVYQVITLACAIYHCTVVLVIE